MAVPARLKAIAVPGYQVPHGGREMPLPDIWGTGENWITASVLTKSDCLKMIDRGSR
jgi:alpha-D-ribose 1-methylphosphonate 5-phosphate C-P lyase